MGRHSDSRDMTRRAARRGGLWRRRGIILGIAGAAVLVVALGAVFLPTGGSAAPRADAAPRSHHSSSHALTDAQIRAGLQRGIYGTTQACVLLGREWNAFNWDTATTASVNALAQEVLWLGRKDSGTAVGNAMDDLGLDLVLYADAPTAALQARETAKANQASVNVESYCPPA